jgi:hypothetical protein
MVFFASKFLVMRKISIVALLSLFILASCGEKKKDVCTCLKESTQMMIDKGFDVDPEKPEYPEGCKYLADMSQDEIDKQIDEACRDEIMKMIFGDFNFDDFDFGEMGDADSTANDEQIIAQ